MRGILVVATLLGSAASSEEWQDLTGTEIETSLNDVTLQYLTARQVFYASGRTLYDAGRPSWGYWTVRGDKYCSQWPPNDGWECYAMQQRISDGSLRFISDTGFETDGQIVE